MKETPWSTLICLIARAAGGRRPDRNRQLEPQSGPAIKDNEKRFKNH
jgi:hypothetical protein